MNDPQTEKDISRKLIRDYLSAIVLAVVVALFIRFFVIEAYRIPSSIMKPTLEAGDTIFVLKSAYGIRRPWAPSRFFTTPKLPERGDVIIFSALEEGKSRDYIKRVIALPGDSIGINKGALIINGRPLGGEAVDLCGPEALPNGRSYTVCWEPPLLEDLPLQTVPKNSVFTLGDLRSAATEQGKTQNWKIVSLEAIRGKAVYIWLSIEPSGLEHSNFFPKFRFDRMLKGIQ